MTPSVSALQEEFGLLWKCFPPQEVQTLRTVLALLPEIDPRPGSEVDEVFRTALRSLPLLAEAIQACPSVLEVQKLGGRERTAETLIDALCSNNGLNIDFLMPTGAVIGHAFVLAKLNFLKALSARLEDVGDRATGCLTGLRDSIVDATFSQLAEEILTRAVSNPANDLDLKRAAARKLITLWSQRVQVPLGDFTPILLSAWRARVKVRAIFGTLIGTSEIFSLLQGECEPRFVDYFAREHAPTDEVAAFREFLFGISYEDFHLIERFMHEQGRRVISPSEVADLVGERAPLQLHGDPTPEQIYTAYCRRRIRADYRRMAGVPGPRKTAEGYIMESLLRKGEG